MDEIAAYNIARWNALVAAGAVFTRPAGELDAAQAQELIDPLGRLGRIAGADVLCLACGGGQQSAAFAALGARVTVADLSEAQLQHDRELAAARKLEIAIVQADMRDLSALPGGAYDIVYHAYSLGFVPDAREVFRQVARVLRPGGRYHFMCANPFVIGVEAGDWNGQGYLLRHPYLNGAERSYPDQEWVYDRAATSAAIPPPREFRHTLSALVSGLVACGFVILHIADDASFTPDPQAPPGSWAHQNAFAPPWLSFWATLRPDVIQPADSEEQIR
jgi:SAM-dependent methyltransferase